MSLEGGRQSFLLKISGKEADPPCDGFFVSTGGEKLTGHSFFMILMF